MNDVNHYQNKFRFKVAHIPQREMPEFAIVIAD